MAVGLKKSAHDSNDAWISQLWLYSDGPEDNPQWMHEGNTHFSQDVSCFAKFHLEVPNEGPISLHIRPLQKLGAETAFKDGLRTLASESSSELSKSRKRLLASRIRQVEKTDGQRIMPGFFDHKERHLALALVGLELSMQLKENGIPVERITLPGKTSIAIWEESATGKTKLNTNISKQYEQVRKVLAEGAKKQGIELAEEDFK